MQRIERGNLFAIDLPTLCRVRLRSKSRLEIRQYSHSDRVDSGRTVIQEISRRKETGHRLDRAALACDKVLRLWRPGFALRAHRERKMPARACPCDPELHRIHTVLRRVMPHKPNRPMDIFG